MPRIALTVTQTTRDGVAAAAEANGDTTNGHVVANTGKTLIMVRNADTSSHNVTFVTPGTVDGQAIADRVVAVAASATRYFSGFQTTVYGSQLGIDVDSTQIKLTAFES